MVVAPRPEAGVAASLTELFHPAVAAWFDQDLGEPTAPQLRAWPSIRARAPTLIAAPTGSGKTLAAFLAIIDDLVRRGLAAGGQLPDATLVVYVSPLKALSNDIERNLERPLAGILERLRASGEPAVEIRTAVRTGDTPRSERAAMLKHPPHILVTTPESLYILLTSEGGRTLLRGTETVIVDEIHAIAGDKRGSHLAVTLERLAQLTARPPLRIGLSATQKPIETVADFLFTERREQAVIVDLGHRRRIDLRLELPRSELQAVMSNEVWEEIYDRLAELVAGHRTTLVFVNTRRLAERVAKNLSDRLGKEAVSSHHGSLSRDQRLDAERRLKAGELRALVATASLELGIDVGAVDLVCQLGATRSIATLLQRVGRSGHAVAALPKGRLFPLSRDELVESVALLLAAGRGELDRLRVPEQPLDILAQQIVATVASEEECSEDELYALMRRSWPFRALERVTFDRVIAMLREGFASTPAAPGASADGGGERPAPRATTGRGGRRSAYLHHDRVNGRLRARRGARLAAITNGGAIPDTADYEVVQEPGAVRIGSVNEDFAVESMAGNIFQLGNVSWRILKIEPGRVRVEDARGAPPTIPFWLGEAPARSDELSREVSELRAQVFARLGPDGAAARPSSTPREALPRSGDPALRTAATAGSDAAAVAVSPERRALEATVAWLATVPGVTEPAARQAVEYLASGAMALGALPTQDTLVLERFFDETGGMQLVLHSPYGSRLNRAWGLALRKRFCRKFNFELQAAATEDAIVLSLGVTHSFPLEEVFAYLNAATVRHVLTQALLDAPVWNVRWRWNASRALAVLRFRGGRRVPPQIQRMNADDLTSLVFPDQLACLENIVGEREVPDHPLVDQTLRDCLEEAMDVEQLERLLRRIAGGEVTLLARDLPEPSPLAQETLNAKPYAFLDDAPLEERRTQAVLSRRWRDPEEVSDLAALDAAAIAAVRDEARPRAESADELHEALVLSGFLTDDEVEAAVADAADGRASSPIEELVEAGRVTRSSLDGGRAAIWVAAERLAQLRALRPEASEQPPLALPPALDERWSGEDALLEVVRGRLEILGPVTVAELARPAGIAVAAVEAALARLEGEGFAMRGRFTPGAAAVEWCERRLLARIHRRTLNRLRAEIEPVPTEVFLRFLLGWQHVTADERKAGPRGLEEVAAQLEGFEVAAGSWEVDVLPDRVEDYESGWLDGLGSAGKVVWQRRTLPSSARPQESGRGPGPAAGGERPARRRAVRAERAPLRSASEREATSSGRVGVLAAPAETRPSGKVGPVRSTPVALLLRANLPLWRRLAGSEREAVERLSTGAREVLRFLAAAGPSFLDDIARGTGRLHTQLEGDLGELAAQGLVYSDSFLGLRALLLPSDRRKPVAGPRRRRTADYGLEDAGRWVALAAPAEEQETAATGTAGSDGAAARVRDRDHTAPPPPASGSRLVASAPDQPARLADDDLEEIARILLRRWGVVFRRLLDREGSLPPWRDLLRVLRRLEARGEIRGGRFVHGWSGEQFALPEAVSALRRERRATETGWWAAVSATDPLNLVGILTPGARLPAISSNRVLYRGGNPVAALLGRELVPLVPLSQAELWEARKRLERRAPAARAALAV